MDGKIQSIKAEELRAMVASSSGPLILDTRLEEDCESCRISGAVGNCVFEVAFESRMREIAPDLHSSICVYGNSVNSMESRMAAEKLCRMGYKTVVDLREGLVEWLAAGFPIEGSSRNLPHPSLAGGHYPINLSESTIRWIGRNLLNRHEGLITLKDGWLRIVDGRVTQGNFTMDMQKIHCLDLAGNSLHDVLIRHLLSHDFFDTEKFPEATFAMMAATAVEKSTPGSLNLLVNGHLTLKGISHPLSFPVTTGMTPEGKAVAQGTLCFDRTLWNVIYGSGKWFSNPGKHLVNDSVDLQLRIVTA